MKVLIGCEYSQIVTKAFREKGHDAYSCDIIETEGNTEWHIQKNILEVIKNGGGGYDLGIFHPPCKYLSYAATRYWHQVGREKKRNEAVIFFMKLLLCDIDKVCIENPVGYMNTILNYPKQIINPYFFGDNDVKKTVLWLKNLKPLLHKKTYDLFGDKTHIVKPKPVYIEKSGRVRYRTDAISGFSKNAEKERARFFPGIAKAMAEQWG